MPRHHANRSVRDGALIRAVKPFFGKINLKKLLPWFTAVTFALSIVSLGWQGFKYYEGPQVRLITPEQITIASSTAVKYPDRAQKGPYVHFIARMSYVNEASTGYNATVSKERIRVTVEGHAVFESTWYNFVSSDAGGKDGSEIVFNTKTFAHPFPMAAGSSESHETVFQPWEKDCSGATPPCSPFDNYVKWDDFVSWFQKDRPIEFEFLADTFTGKQPVTAKCRIVMYQEQFDSMKQRQWTSPLCAPLK
jgi:hypothetical protein